jgi:hypothetical protein
VYSDVEMNAPLALSWRGLLVIALAMAFVAALTGTSLPERAAASGGLDTENLNELTPEELADSLVGSGVEVSNVTYTGSPLSAGKFTGGTGIIGFESGIVLSTGSIRNVRGPNRDEGITTVTSEDGDPDLDSLVPAWNTTDAAVLEFDFVAENDTISFQYVFASDEYNEFVNTSFSDVFGFFLDGVNIAFVPGTSVPVSINTVNRGQPFGNRSSAQNPEYFINNDPRYGGGALNTEMDGLTVVLPVTASVTPGHSHHLKLAIADVTDRYIDSNIFIRSGSLSGTHPPLAEDDEATVMQGEWVDIDVLDNDSDSDDDELSVISVSQPASGSASINGDDTVRYTASDSFVGVDYFSYAVDDGNGGVGTATVIVTVLGPGGSGPTGELVVVDDAMRLVDLDTDYDEDDARAGAGVYFIDATFVNVGDVGIVGLVFEVKHLTGSNVLINADGGPGAQGASLTVPGSAFDDGVLDPGESVSQRFEIGVSTTQPFSFFVNVLAELE